MALKIGISQIKSPQVLISKNEIEGSVPSNLIRTLPIVATVILISVHTWFFIYFKLVLSQILRSKHHCSDVISSWNQLYEFSKKWLTYLRIWKLVYRPLLHIEYFPTWKKFFWLSKSSQIGQSYRLNSFFLSIYIF